MARTKKPTKKTNPYVSTETITDYVARRAAVDVEFAISYRSAAARRALATAIREARERRSLTQVALARAVGTSQPNIARLEAGMVEPRLRQLSRIAAALHLGLDIRFVALAR
jgi:ribosome-binding protein aMBF1 (putative translation factor)